MRPLESLLPPADELALARGEILVQALQEVGGGRVRVIQDPVFVGSDGGLQIANDAPESEWVKLGG